MWYESGEKYIIPLVLEKPTLSVLIGLGPSVVSASFPSYHWFVFFSLYVFHFIDLLSLTLGYTGSAH